MILDPAMFRLHSIKRVAKAGMVILGLGLLAGNARAQAPSPATLTASDLAARLAAMRESGSAFVKVRAEISRPSTREKSVLQLQIKSRRSPKRTELVYQLIWPKERKGEAVLLVREGPDAPNGITFTPPGTLRTLEAAQLKSSLFGTDLALDDLVDDCYSWKHQSFGTAEMVDGVGCRILESRPGPGEWSSCAKVLSWVDLERTVPLRVEKYSLSGTLIRRIETHKVVKENGRFIPASFLVRQAGRDSQTEFESTRGDRDVAYTDSDFSPAGLPLLTPPPQRPE